MALPIPDLFYQIYFMLVLVSVISIHNLLSVVTFAHWQCRYAPWKQDAARRFCYSMLYYCVRIIFTLNPQISVKSNIPWSSLSSPLASTPLLSRVGQSGNGKRPITLLLNHQCHLDTFVAGAYCIPRALFIEAKLVVSKFITTVPILAWLINSLRAIVVHYKAFGENASFATDTEKMKKTNKLMKDHLATPGKMLLLYPEGNFNYGDVTQLQTFRKGSFAKFLEADAEIYGICLTGTQDCWAAKSKMGGKPANIEMEFFEICPEGCRKFLEMGTEHSEGFQEEAALLANRAQALFQQRLDEMMRRRTDNERE